MNASRLLLALAASVLVVACAPEPAPPPKVEQAVPAPEAPRPAKPVSTAEVDLSVIDSLVDPERGGDKGRPGGGS